ncbi:LysE family translocator [Polycladidibacter hongkongensis]|uniref:LysE family translocator n=1 Tax=Polycladidibacter hongkongensis TaxID=1647556 RepID=UPI0008296ACC|nr:LysE family translocator [Pseudovibrio hongkongensis]
MLPLETLSAFFAVAVVLALAPGPDNIFVLTQSATSGWRAGLLVTLGLSTGIIFHSAAVALGVSAIFKSSELAFSLVKYVGAAYLLYLALGAFRAKPMQLDAEGSKAQSVAVNARALYLRGVIMNITNPKVAIFFLSLLPQFVSPEHGALLPQFLQLGACFMLVTLLVFGGIALAAGHVGQRLFASQTAQNVMNKVTSLVFVGLALKLATATR